MNGHDEVMDDVLYTYDIPTLQAGDILLSTTEQKPSKFIRKMTQSDYSHAMLYVHNTIIHAEGDGVFTTNPQRRMFPAGASTVLRLRESAGVNFAQICDFAVSRAGGLYSVPEALLAAMLQNTGTAALSPAQYCSRLVAQAYRHGGVALVPNPDYCSPGDLFRSPLLKEVPGATRQAIEGELRIFATPDTVKIHQQHTFAWLERVRDIAKQHGVVIASISSGFDFVAAHPEHDVEIADALRQSGYLEDFNLDRVPNPHRYDIEHFRALLRQHPTEVERIVEKEVEINDDAINNILPQLQQFVGTSLEVFRLARDMHIHRLEQVLERIRVIQAVAKEHSLTSVIEHTDASAFAIGKLLETLPS